MITRSPVLGDALRNPGSFTSVSIRVPTGTTRVGVAMQRVRWHEGTGDTVDLQVELSDNAGQTWRPHVACTSSAKVVLDRQGNPTTETSCLCRLNQDDLQRDIRARVVLNVLEVCEGSVELLFDDTPIPEREPPHNSVTYDNDLETTNDSVSSLTISSFTVGNNADRYMIVGVGTWDSDVADSAVSSVTFNGSGTGWGLIDMELGPDSLGSINRVTLWGAKAIAVATGSVVITLVGTTAELGANALSVYNVDQTTPVGTPNSAEGDNDSIASVDVTAATDDLVYDILYCNKTNPSVPTAGANQTPRCNTVIINHANSTVLASTEPGVATTTMSWDSGANQFQEWVQLGVALKNAASVGPADPVRGRRIYVTP